MRGAFEFLPRTSDVCPFLDAIAPITKNVRAENRHLKFGLYHYGMLSVTSVRMPASQPSSAEAQEMPQDPRPGQKGYIHIAEHRCKGCDLCIPVCPVDIIEKADPQHVNEMGWRPVQVSNMGRCVACALCAVVCPDLAIDVFRFIKPKRA